VGPLCVLPGTRRLGAESNASSRGSGLNATPPNRNRSQTRDTASVWTICSSAAPELKERSRSKARSKG
jgi:hypothetical protein